jgi:hypothetical protein
MFVLVGASGHRIRNTTSHEIEPVAPQPYARFYTEGRRLMDDYVSAQLEALTLQNQEEVVAIALSGERLDRFDLDLATTRRRRDAAKRAWMEHITEHRCSDAASLATRVGRRSVMRVLRTAYVTITGSQC